VLDKNQIYRLYIGGNDRREYCFSGRVGIIAGGGPKQAGRLQPTEKKDPAPGIGG